MKRWLREPLLHFLVLGILLFLGYGVIVGQDPARGGEIVVDAARIEILKSQFSATWQRDPTDAEVDGLVQNYIREETFYREGTALGLDRDDPVIRRRLQQKLQFVAESSAASDPTPEQLREYFAAHHERYEFEPRYSFLHVVANSDQDGRTAMQRVQHWLMLLQAAGEATSAYRSIGDPSLLPQQFDLALESEIGRSLGDQFARDLAVAPTGRWLGPVASAYGLHLIHVTETIARRRATFDEVQAEVRRDWMRDQQRQALDLYLASLRERYPVRIELPGPRVNSSSQAALSP